MADSLQFSVTRVDQNTYRVVVQDTENIIRTSLVDAAGVIDELEYELEQLKSQE